LSGELKAMVEWEPPDPTKEPPKRRRRRRRTPPATRGAAILYGLRRLALVLVTLVGVVTLIAAIVVWAGDSSASHVFPLVFYFAGAGVGVAAIFGGTGTFTPSYWGRTTGSAGVTREQAFNTSFVLALLAIFLFGLGVALDYLL
jgi:hypothetical protein